MRKDKTPFILKFVRWLFPKLEIVAPFLAHRYFVKIFFTPLRYPLPEKEREVQARSEKFTIHVLDKKIQCYSWGSGPLVYVVHGWAGRASQFRKIIERLIDEGYRVVGFDGPAHGHSEGKSTTIIEFEAVLIRLYKEVGVPEGIIAHSFGGGAVLFSAMNGLPVKSLINIASPTIADKIIATYLNTINGSAKSGAYLKNYIKETMGKDFEEFTGSYVIRHLKQKINLLLIHDVNDKDVDIENAYEILKYYPEARLYKTEGLGHTRILKDEDVAGQCVTFFNEARLSK